MQPFDPTRDQVWNLDISILEWQHDPSHIATFEWLWRTSRDVESHKVLAPLCSWCTLALTIRGDIPPQEELRLPDWRQLEAQSVAFPHEGMDPYEDNYEIKWIGWLIASARFLLDHVQVKDPQVQQWCRDIARLRHTLSAGTCRPPSSREIVVWLIRWRDTLQVRAWMDSSG